MKRIIGIGKPKPLPPTISETIDAVDRKAENIRSKIKQCDMELIQIREQLKRLHHGSPSMNSVKEKAQRILQRKKHYESMENNLQDQSFNMEQATAAIQTASGNQQIVSAMKRTVKEIRQVYKKIGLDEIDDLQEKMEDILEVSDGIEEALGRSNMPIPDIDEDQLEAELDALGDEMIRDSDKSYLDAVTKDPFLDLTGLGKKTPTTSIPISSKTEMREKNASLKSHLTSPTSPSS